MLARQISPDIDRLVLSVNANAMENDRSRLAGMAADQGLESLALLPQIADFLLAGTMGHELAVIRMRYRPPEAVVGRLEELASGGYLQETERGYVATASLRPILEAILAGHAATAAEMWSDHAAQVDRAGSIARQVIDGATGDHLVAVVHRDLPDPADPYGRLHRRLVTLRYIRQHDHSEAWLAQGLSASEMVLLTGLWKGETVEAGEEAASLVERGLVTEDRSSLTEEGLHLREAVEEDTNRRAQASFDVLDDATADEFLAVIRQLPGEVD